MINENIKLLESIITRRNIKLFKLSKAIDVTTTELSTFLAGMPINEPQEIKIAAFVEGGI